MGKRLQEMRRLPMLSLRSNFSTVYYVIVITFLCVAIVLLRSSPSLRLPPSYLNEIAGDRQTPDALLHQEIVRHSFMKGSWDELQQKQLDGVKGSAAIPSTRSGVYAQNFSQDVGAAAVDHNKLSEDDANPTTELLPEDDANPTTELPLQLMTGSVGEKDQQANGNEDRSKLDVLELHDHSRVTELMVSSPPRNLTLGSVGSAERRCDGGRLVYMYPLPAVFHSWVVKQCDNKMVDWLNFCPHIQNHGFGRNLNGANDTETDWYATDPYMLEVIFHARMPHHPCFTQDPSLADAFFIPYYSGLDALRFLYGKNRSDASSQGRELVDWLEQNAAATWRRRGGLDHFIVMGRTAWDFGRPLTITEGWGTGLLSLPEMENVTAFFLERRPWKWNEQAIPYPTAFHPSSLQSLRDWQSKVRSASRPFLFAFVGAPRLGKAGSIRQAVLQQCLDANDSSPSSSSCAFVDCQNIKCAHNPEPITETLLQSEFCLQPPGDTPTRRSTFDGMLAGCIPVFFDNDSAYTQYTWHLPENADQYSVLIPSENLNRVQQILSSYSSEKIHAMRAAIVDMIPTFIYASSKALPEFKQHSIEDAFDLSVKGMLQRVAAARSVTVEIRVFVDSVEHYDSPICEDDNPCFGGFC